MYTCAQRQGYQPYLQLFPQEPLLLADDGSLELPDDDGNFTTTFLNRAQHNNKPPGVET